MYTYRQPGRPFTAVTGVRIPLGTPLYLPLIYPAATLLCRQLRGRKRILSSGGQPDAVARCETPVLRRDKTGTVGTQGSGYEAHGYGTLVWLRCAERPGEVEPAVKVPQAFLPGLRARRPVAACKAA